MTMRILRSSSSVRSWGEIQSDRPIYHGKLKDVVDGDDDDDDYDDDDGDDDDDDAVNYDNCKELVMIFRGFCISQISAKAALVTFPDPPLWIWHYHLCDGIKDKFLTTFPLEKLQNGNCIFALI